MLLSEPTIPTIYTLNIWRVNETYMQGAIERLSLHIFDVRLAPSKASREHLKSLFGPLYQHERDLGENAERQIRNLARGVEHVKMYLDRGMSVVLICDCQRNHCHIERIVDELSDDYPIFELGDFTLWHMSDKDIQRKLL